MLIKHKLYGLAALAVAALLLLLAGTWWSWRDIDKLGSAQLLSLNLDKQMLLLRRHEKDFMLRLDMKYPKEFDDTIKAFNGDLTSLKTLLDEQGVESRSLGELESHIQDYSDAFHKLVSQHQTVGLDPESGLYGSLRDAVHAAEASVRAEKRDDLLAAILMERRHEKDFMLRLQTKYVDEFNTDFVKLNALVDSKKVGDDLATYKHDFLNLVAAQQQIGLTPNDGLTGELRQQVQATEQLFENIDKELTQVLADEKASTLWHLVLFALVIALALVVLAVMIVRQLNSQLERSINTMQRIATDCDLTHGLDQDGKDELTQMGRHFNQMMEGVRALVRQSKQAVEYLSRATSELSANAEETSAGSKEQLSQTDLVATAITQMGSTIEEIARNTEQAAVKAQEANENAQLGHRQLQGAINRIEQLAGQLENSTLVVDELVQSAHTIGSVLDVIRGIAEQTNLLALNAAIEAARAGDQGRGFAVVADEVRTLAMRTQTSTEEIAQIIKTLQQKTQSIVSLMEDCRGEGLESAGEAQKAGELLGHITRDVTRILDMNTQIAAAIEEQSQVATEVNRNVVVIRDVAEQTASASHGNAETSAHVAEQAEELAAVISRFKV
ncbi:methyl-accepting chemotaxis protein [Gallaecimonas kandeliae]|uniref:methyl-accepting chemotaxis protein n=1 Tax=Gallaecimonas kandeliae TaxID=3029055 RepID=UPI00264764BC|nr:methyl-accepting chemotaxis protein [Gallaecimonas kandeliae]WKE65335.1 methyl-accepting chemotaxis protein [Gallaecimonas kandeliae]